LWVVHKLVGGAVTEAAFAGATRRSKFSWDFTFVPADRCFTSSVFQADPKLTPKLVGTAGLEPAASRFQAGPSAADITPRKNFTTKESCLFLLLTRALIR
jgi:hypothetical protein